MAKPAKKHEKSNDVGGFQNGKGRKQKDVTEGDKKPPKRTKKEKAALSWQLGLVPDFTSKKDVKPASVYCDDVSFIDDTPPVIAKIIFDGSRSGLVSYRGIIFRVDTKRICVADISVVSVYNAPQGTELADISGDNTFVTVGQLHCPIFRTKLTDLKSVNVQEKIYNFWRKAFKEEGLLDPVFRDVPFVPAEKKLSVQTVITFKFNPLGQMLSGTAGYYDLGNSIAELVVKLYKKHGKHQIEVAKISENHPLSNCNIKVGFVVSAEVFFDEGEHGDSTTAFINYVREFMLSRGVVKTFKKNVDVGVLLSTPKTSEASVTPDIFDKPRLATVDGKIVYGTIEEPKALGRGFLTDSYGYWVTNDDVVIRCWSHDGVWYAKLASVPSGHTLNGNKKFIKIKHLILEEVDPPMAGREVREFLRTKLHEVGEL